MVPLLLLLLLLPGLRADSLPQWGQQAISRPPTNHYSQPAATPYGHPAANGAYGQPAAPTYGNQYQGYQYIHNSYSANNPGNYWDWAATQGYGQQQPGHSPTVASYSALHGPWGPWSPCSAAPSCQGGRRTQRRRCEAYRCSGASKRVEQCNKQDCAARPPPPSPHFGPAAPASCGHGRLRVRRNVFRLSPHKRRKLVTAFRKAIRNGQWGDQFAGYHGWPTTKCGSRVGLRKQWSFEAADEFKQDYCCHQDPANFLPWHRLMMVNLESVTGLGWPYWDWTVAGTFPNIFEELWQDVFRQHPGLPIGGNGSDTSIGMCLPGHPDYQMRQQGRLPDRAVNQHVELKKKIRFALTKRDFEEFSTQVEGPHGTFHDNFACNMGSLTWAGFDPLFTLHHGFIDFLYAYWQELQRLRGVRIEQDQNFIALDIEMPNVPFNDPSLNFQPLTSAKPLSMDTLDYRNNYCFDFDELLFDGLTPAQYHRRDEDRFLPQTVCVPASTAVPCNQGCSGPNPEHCETLAMEIGDDYLVGVVIPKKVPAGRNYLELCVPGDHHHPERCLPAGEFSTFGIGKRHSHGSHSVPVSRKTHKIIEFNVTDVVNNEEWHEETLTARLTPESVVQGVPPPVVILRAEDESSSGFVVMGKGEGHKYGDLLKKYRVEEGGHHL